MESSDERVRCFPVDHGVDQFSEWAPVQQLTLTRPSRKVSSQERPTMA